MSLTTNIYPSLASLYTPSLFSPLFVMFTIYIATNAEEKAVEAENEEEEEEKEGAIKGYDYLLSMPLWNLSMEKVRLSKTKTVTLLRKKYELTTYFYFHLTLMDRSTA